MPPRITVGPSGEPPPGRRRGRAPRRIFFGFIGVFGFMTLMFLGWMAVLAFLITRLFGGDGQTTIILWIGGIGFALALPILAISMAVRAFRGIAMPLGEIVQAADSVADGDLSVQVQERGSGQFSRLARSFNRMVRELDQNEQLRRNLTADVAHELRTPLHIIQGNLEGVLDGVYQPDSDHIGATLDETRLLARLVDDLRTLSLAESGQLPLHMERTDLCVLLQDVGTSFSGQAEEAGVELRVECPEGSLWATVDPARMDQVLTNLVANALRHTSEGGHVVLTGDFTPEGSRVTVADNGEGIPPDDLPHIFDRFWRGDRSRTREGGTGGGLGLSIARQLVQAHDGRISVQSEQGLGTTFTIELPSVQP